MLKRLLSAFKQYIKFKPGAYVKSANWYYADYKTLQKADNKDFVLADKWLYPCLTDKTENTPLDHVYFYQNAWAAARIFKYRPAKHVDIGSQAGFVGIISQFVPTTMIDIRPIDVVLPGLNFMKGDILALPIKDNELESVSSICVIEHIGLGRYGDAIDAYGSEKSAFEIERIVRSGGKIIITVPVAPESRIYFNAHRSFTREHIVKLFPKCKLIEEEYIYGDRMYPTYDPAKGFGTGLFFFEKN